MYRSTGTTGLFDRWSRTYDSAALQRSTYRPVHDAVLGRLDDLAPEVVLDLGCGTGQLTARLIERFPGARVIGADLSAGMLGEAAARVGDSVAGLVRSDAQRLPLRPGSVDVVTCVESFHWYPDQAAAAREVGDLLRHDGRFVIASIATVSSTGARLLRRATERRGAAVRALAPHDLDRLLDRAGFDVVHQRRVPRWGPLTWPVLTEARRR
ncbi:MAG: class I SAM-dependent methyltransferase [Actinomycetota bacterium]